MVEHQSNRHRRKFRDGVDFEERCHHKTINGELTPRIVVAYCLADDFNLLNRRIRIRIIAEQVTIDELVVGGLGR